MSFFSRFRKRLVTGTAAAATALSFAATADRAEAELVTAVLQTGAGVQSIATFQHTTPGTLLTNLTITGLGAEVINGIDFRPSTYNPAAPSVFATTTLNRILSINTLTGAATLVATIATAPVGGGFGIDFNPVADLVANNPSLRHIGDGGQNLAIRVTDGVTTAQTGTSPTGIAGSAYNNNDINPATGTTLFGISPLTDSLLSTADPAGGAYSVVGAAGSLGAIDDQRRVSFDISGTGLALGAWHPGASGGGVSGTNLFSINLANGTVSSLGVIGNATLNTLGIALAPDITPAAVPEPSSMLLLGLCGVGAAGYRMRRKKAAEAV